MSNHGIDLNSFYFESPSYFSDPNKYYAEFLKKYPVFYNKNDNCFVISRYGDVKMAFENYSTFGSESGVLPRRNDDANHYGFDPIFMISPPKQTRLRKLAAPAFSIATSDAASDMIREIATEILDRIEVGGKFDLIEEYATPLVVKSVARMIGVGQENLEEYYDLALKVINGRDFTSNEDTSFIKEDETVMKFGKALISHFDSLKQNMIPGFADKIFNTVIDDDRLSHGEMFGMFYMAAMAGAEEAIRAFGNVLFALWENPDQKQIMLKDVDGNMKNCISEALRVHTTTHYLRRNANQDFTLHDTDIPKGAIIVIMVAAANRDERQFEAPETFDLMRKNSNASLAFGAGPHSCMGRNIARSILKTGIKEFLDRYPNYSLDLQNSARVRRGMIFGYGHLMVATNS